MEEVVGSQIVPTPEALHRAWLADRLRQDPQISIRKQKILNHIREKGIKDFVETFIGAYNESDYVIDPHEFFEGNLLVEYNHERMDFDLNFYRRFMAKLEPETIAEKVASHAGQDIPLDVMNNMGL